MIDLSIVIPAYNEEDRLGETLREVASFVDSYPGSTEVIVVDDGSVDRTASVAASNGELGVRVIRSALNRGKGHAVRTGMLAATGKLRLFTDADSSTSMDQYDALATALPDDGRCGIAIASIGVPGADVVVPQRGLRPLAGRFGNAIIRLTAVSGIKDSQRGFKLFTGDAADDIFARCVIDRWAFDVEALAIARELSISVSEVPVRWMHKDDSRVTALSYVATLFDVLRIRRRIWTGVYRSARRPSVDTTP